MNKQAKPLSKSFPIDYGMGIFNNSYDQPKSNMIGAINYTNKKPFLTNVKPTPIQRLESVRKLKQNDTSYDEHATLNKINRVILACNNNPKYTEFWKPVAYHWRVYHKITPTLFFIGTDEEAKKLIDFSCGDVIVINNLSSNVSTVFAAQVIRLLGPGLFPDDVCIVADIDMFVLRTDFFPSYLKFVPMDSYLQLNRYDSSVGYASMCYNIAKGSTFLELFGQCDTIEKITFQLQDWYNRISIWSSDEFILFYYTGLFQQKQPGRFFRLYIPGLFGRSGGKIITRFAKGVYNEKSLQNRVYIEYDPPRLYSEHMDLHRKILKVYFPDWPF